MKKLLCIISLLLILLLPISAIAGQEAQRSKGQTIFIPAAWTDHSYQTSDGNTISARATSKLNIWNLDPENSIWISEINFVGSDGEVLYEYIPDPEDPLELLPSNSISYRLGVLPFPPFVNEIGRPYFIFKWHSEKEVIAPCANAVIPTIELISPGNYRTVATINIDGIVVNDK
jgi:hypothetical protein